MDDKRLKYTGKGLLEAKTFQEMDLLPYLPAPELVEAVNIAIHLERPLLLKGEPGCGKSYLAKAVACELGLPYYEFNVKSTSKAREALYNFNHIAHLRDAQLAHANFLRIEEVEERERNRHYVNLGPIGKAFQSEKRAVLLIDEIDKADLDFPNDLLEELEDMQFRITELEGRALDNVLTVKAQAGRKPIVFITSNDEKDLPAPFLRRCLYHEIEFPKTDRLKDIVKAHLKFKDNDKEDFLSKAVVRFEALRIEQQSLTGTGQKASTSELLDWFKIMIQNKQQERKSQEALDLDQLPFPGVLIKNPILYERYLSSKSLTR